MSGQGQNPRCLVVTVGVQREPLQQLHQNGQLHRGPCARCALHSLPVNRMSSRCWTETIGPRFARAELCPRHRPPTPDRLIRSSATCIRAHVRLRKWRRRLACIVDLREGVWRCASHAGGRPPQDPPSSVSRHRETPGEPRFPGVSPCVLARWLHGAAVNRRNNPTTRFNDWTRRTSRIVGLRRPWRPGATPRACYAGVAASRERHPRRSS